MWFDLPKRLADKIIPEPNSGCWLWLGSIHPKGYGLVKNEFGKTEHAHRVVYRATGRVIPQGLVLDHLCRLRTCVNPNHLEPVTNLQNYHRGFKNHNTSKTHCGQGHPFDEVNTYLIRGERVCRECQRRWNQAWKERQRVV